MGNLETIINKIKEKLTANNYELLKRIGIDAAIALVYGAKQRKKGMNDGWKRGYEKGIGYEYDLHYRNLVSHVKAEVPYAFEDENGKYHRFYPESMLDSEGMYDKKLDGKE